MSPYHTSASHFAYMCVLLKYTLYVSGILRYRGKSLQMKKMKMDGELNPLCLKNASILFLKIFAVEVFAAFRYI